MASAIQDIIPESRLLFVQISSIYQKTAAKAWYKDGFEEMEHEFPFGTIRPENQNFLFRCSGNFHWNDTKSRVPLTLYQVLRKLSVNGKKHKVTIKWFLPLMLELLYYHPSDGTSLLEQEGPTNKTKKLVQLPI